MRAGATRSDPSLRRGYFGIGSRRAPVRAYRRSRSCRSPEENAAEAADPNDEATDGGAKPDCCSVGSSLLGWALPASVSIDHADCF